LPAGREEAELQRSDIGEVKWAYLENGKVRQVVYSGFDSFIMISDDEKRHMALTD
jgi:hypothetical protein